MFKLQLFHTGNERQIMMISMIHNEVYASLANQECDCIHSVCIANLAAGLINVL